MRAPATSMMTALRLFFDAKYVEVRDGDRLRPAAIYVVAGLGTDGKKRVLACVCKLGVRISRIGK